MDKARVARWVEAVSVEQAFGFLVRVEDYARLMPNVRAVEVLEDGGHTRLTRWDTEIEGAPLRWVERDTVDPGAHSIRFELAEGDFARLSGSWSVEACAGGAVLVCELGYSLGVPLLEDLLGPVLREKLTEHLATMLDGLAQGLRGAESAS
jgi:ribosome-associated toxin RatA of RatAB toxin-antitoxin module